MARHDSWREEGSVVVTVIPRGTGREAFEAHNGARGRSVVVSAGSGARTLGSYVTSWLDGVPRSLQVEGAARRVGARTGLERDELAAAFAARAPAELGRWIDGWALDFDDRIAAEIAARSFGAAGARGAAVDAPVERRAAAMVRMAGTRAPALLVTMDDDVPPREVAAIATMCGRLATILRPASVAWSVSPAQLRAYLDGAPESASKALVRQAWCGEDDPTAAPGTGRRASRDLGEARSLAEQLLHDALEADPRTRGHFALNARPGVVFGDRPAEIDLYCARARVALEIDGYFHFQDEEAYRRDRRKDVALQSEGCFVMRFLAADVVADPRSAVHRVAEVLALLDTRGKDRRL